MGGCRFCTVKVGSVEYKLVRGVELNLYRQENAVIYCNRESIKLITVNSIITYLSFRRGITHLSEAVFNKNFTLTVCFDKICCAQLDWNDLSILLVKFLKTPVKKPF